MGTSKEKQRVRAYSAPSIQKESGESGAVMSKYNRKIDHLVKEDGTVDVYDVLEAFNVTCPALQHLAKKALCTGLRGHKDKAEDLRDILESAARAVQLDLMREKTND